MRSPCYLRARAATEEEQEEEVVVVFMIMMVMAAASTGGYPEAALAAAKAPPAAVEILLTTRHPRAREVVLGMVVVDATTLMAVVPAVPVVPTLRRAKPEVPFILMATATAVLLAVT